MQPFKSGKNKTEDNGIENKKDTGFDFPVRLDEIADDLFVQTRRLLLVGEIDDIVSTHICSHLQVLSLKKSPVFMYIDSSGGCMSAGYAIIDQMQSCRCPIYTVVRGRAHSMGAIIAAYGQKGHRHAMPNSSLMLHSMIIDGPPESIERHMSMTEYFEEDYMNKVADLAKRLKINKTTLAEIMNETIWMSPKSAIKIGLIDSIWTSKMEQEVSRSFKE